MKLALIIPTLDRSGAEKQLTLLACGLRARGYEPHVFALDRGGPYEADLHAAGAPVTVIGKRGKLNFGAMRRLRTALTEFAPDVVHTWLFSAHAYGAFAMRGLDASWVQSLRCVDSWKSGWQRLIDRRLWPRVDRFVANSQSVRAWYASLGVDESRIDVVPNGVGIPDGSELPLTDRLQGQRRASIPGVPDDARIVLSVGRLAKQKRIKDLLWGFQLLRQANENVWFVVVGDGPQSAELREYSRRVEAAKQTTFLGHCDDPGPYFASASAFWIASDFEGQSNALQEAMAHGLPVIASAIEPNRELVNHGEQGYLVDVGDSAGFAQFTTRLLEDHELAQKLGTLAKRRIEVDFDTVTMIDRYVEIYKKLVD